MGQLIQAISEGDLEKVNSIKIKNFISKKGHPILNYAIKKGNKEIVQLLINKGADVNAVNAEGHPILNYAIKKGNKEIVQLLLDNDADVNAVDSRGFTILNYAIKKGNKEIVQLLLDKGADVNAVDSRGQTALMLAAQQGNKEMFELLYGLNLSVARASFYITTVLGLGLIGLQAVKNMAVVKGALGIYNNWVLYGLMALFLVSAVVLGRQSYKVEKCLKSYQQLRGLKEPTGLMSTIGVLSGIRPFDINMSCK